MLASLRRCTLDIEANGLLNNETIDYTASPYRLKDNFKIWCIVCLDIDSDEVFKFGPDQIKTDFMQFKSQIGTLIAHNGINYDLLALKLYLGIDYHIPYDVEDKGMWDGREVNIIDTMILSKTLNPDRFGGHSLDEWGKRVGYSKIDWRAEAVKLGLITHDAPKGAEFQQYHPAMMDYCVRDNEVTKLTYLRLMQEWGNWPFEEASCTEHKVADIITRQSHRGFDFKKTQAEDAVRDLDTKIENIRIKVEPVLPTKRLPKTKLKEYTPTTKQFNKDGSFSANMVKFVNKHGGEFLEDNKVKIYGVVYDTPLPVEPLVSEAPSTLKDTTHIKEWLVGLGWEPTQFKERDLTVDSKKKKLTAEKFEAAVNRYVEQTLESNFCKFRLEHLKTTSDKLLEKLLTHDISKPLKVLTNPTFTVGQEKEIDPMLERMIDIFPYTQDLVEYLTYNHRRNSILGGGFDPDEDEEDEYEKGFLANIREDGRISTPARTCDCATGRMQHNIVANIPRVTSLYGDVMRGLFGVSSGFVQVGYDFSSLEARIEAHYTWKYDPSSTKEYCNSLILEKPHDVHCYSEDTEILTENGWKRFGDLIEGEKVAQWDKGIIEFVVPSEIVWQKYKGKMLHMENQVTDQLVTPNHRVLSRSDRQTDYSVLTAVDFNKMKAQRHFPVCGKSLNSFVEDYYLRLAVATQADGYLNTDCSAISFSFTKQRKIERLIWLLTKIGAPYTISYHTRKGREETTIRMNASSSTKEIRNLLTENKELKASLCLKNPQLIIDETQYWDGTINSKGDIVLDTTDVVTRDIVQACGVLSGSKAVANTYERSTSYGSTVMHRVYLSLKNKTQSVSIKPFTQSKFVDYEGMIGCVVVPSSFIVVRRNGKVVVSGNTKTAEKITNMIGKEFSRGNAKAVKYACVPVDNTKVLTLSGWKEYGELQVGDKIFNYSTKHGCMVVDEIIAIPFYKEAQVYKLGSIETTKDHNWLVRKDSQNFEYKTSEDIKEEDHVVVGFDIYGHTFEKAGITMEAEGRKTDVFCLTTNNGNFFIEQKGMLTLTGNCSYGAQAPKLMKTIGCDMQTAEKVFKAFWEAAAPLAKLKENLTKYWETTGQRSFILGLDKRRIPTRSKHALVNSLFQSAGVIVAKKAMILHERKLREEGYYVDFFVEDWKNKKFCQQLIAYHDEAQLELSKAFVKDFKMFKFEVGNEESEKAAKKATEEYKKQRQEETGLTYSEVGHMADYYYVCYTRAGELAYICAKEAGKYYGLNVEMGADYIVGSNWATCH